MLISGLIFITALLGWFFCGFVRQHLLRAAMLDIPTDRSLHRVPVPRGGGVGIWLAVLPVWIITLWPNVPWKLVAGLLLLLAVSLWDDKRALPPGLRFAVHILAVVLGLFALDNGLVFQGFLPLWADHLLAGLCWLWFINLTNFMDGIDGISVAETSHLSLGVLLFAPTPFQPLAACLLGGVLGFLPWNWHKARLFLGDVGSIGLGYLLGYLLLSLAIAGHLGIALCLPLYYVADASVTLLRRIVQGEKFWQPHRTHFYQQAALLLGRHDRVVWIIIVGNLGLLGIAAASTMQPLLLWLAPLLVAGQLWYLKRLSR